MRKNILLVDDEISIRQTLGGILADEGYEVVTAASGEEALRILKDEPCNLILLDIWLPGIDGIETLRIIRSEFPQARVIMISGHGTIETAVKSTKLGAYDFIEKPLSLDKVILVINHAFEMIRLEEENMLLRQKYQGEYELTGQCANIVELKDMISVIAPTNAWILIMGENGTGKELVARSIHRFSKRAQKAFIEVNCAAIPEDLIESELFGHEKGAFTGATEKKRGKFDLANEGTIFLDEIADMSLKAQAKILRILQEKKFERVGGNKLISTDVRVLAATNKDLEMEMEQGRFRQDLFYRLNVIPLRVPPLRERKDDIPNLVKRFLWEYSARDGQKEKTMSQEAIEMLKQHDWPGNVRELKNIVERLVILTVSDRIEADDIPPLGKKEDSAARAELPVNWADSLKDAKLEFEREYLIEKIKEHDGNISRTAEAIGLERSNLHRKIKFFKIDELVKSAKNHEVGTAS